MHAALKGYRILLPIAMVPPCLILLISSRIFDLQTSFRNRFHVEAGILSGNMHFVSTAFNDIISMGKRIKYEPFKPRIPYISIFF